MIIDTQYNIGDKVWVIKPNYTAGIVEVFDDYIDTIKISANDVVYTMKNNSQEEYLTNDLQPYERNITNYIAYRMQKIKQRRFNLTVFEGGNILE